MCSRGISRAKGFPDVYGYYYLWADVLFFSFPPTPFGRGITRRTLVLHRRAVATTATSTLGRELCLSNSIIATLKTHRSRTSVLPSGFFPDFRVRTHHVYSGTVECRVLARQSFTRQTVRGRFWKHKTICDVWILIVQSIKSVRSVWVGKQNKVTETYHLNNMVLKQID